MVSPTRVTLLLAAVAPVALASFSPLPMHHFAEKPEQTGTRRFSHEEHHLLPGGTALSLRWSADADPDTIMALDTEHTAGVRLASCMPTQLVLHLPASHVGKAKTWKHITASDHLHGCAHLVDHPLYHRVESMEFTKHPDTPKGGSTVVLSTKELYSISQVLPSVDFDYKVVPIDSLHPDLQEEARQQYAQQKELAVSARRLQPAPLVAGAPKWSWGNVSAMGANLGQHGFKKSIGEVTITNSMDTVGDQTQAANWKPMTHANFGWNWNYHTNTTRNPQFKFKLPGMRGYVLMKNPYLKFLGNCKINFRSHWNDVNPFATPPVVKMKAAFEGNAYINADMSLMANIYRDVSEDPFGRFHIPLLNNFTKETHYFQKAHFFIANIPIMLQPGVSVNLNAYHLGLFKGAVRLGVNVQLHIQASADYDSLLDPTMEFKVSALNVKLLPPTWMIYTKHLEFGALLTPSFWIKGGIGPVRDITLELQLRPYCNVSITQEGHSAYGVQQQVMEKELVIVPFRAINLQIGSEWSVGIEANGRKKMTSTEMSLGVVEFSDNIEHFRFGLIDQRRLLREPINVCLFRWGVRQEGKIVPIYCESVMDGECQPAPFNVEFLIGGQTVIVQLTVAWHAQPVPFLLSKVRAMSVVFPQLALSAEASRDYTADPPTKVVVKITRNGREYRSTPNVRVIHDQLVMLESNQTQDLGVAWLDTWRIRYGSIDGSEPSYGGQGQPSVTNLIDPSVELCYVRNGREELVAQAFLPSVHWQAILPGTADSQYNSWYNGASGVAQTGASAFGGLFGQKQPSAPMGGNQKTGFPKNPKEVFRDQRRLQGTAPAGIFVGNVPLTVSLTGRFSGNSNAPFATGSLGIDVHSPARSNRWLRPHHSERFVQGSTHTLYWTIRGAIPEKTQSFQFIAFKVDTNTGVYTPTSMNMRLTDQICSFNDAGARAYMGYGTECAYSQQLQVDPGLVGITVIFELVWFQASDGTFHKMMSAPVSFISSSEPERGAAQWGSRVVNWPNDDRKLSEEGGNMVQAPPSSDKEVEIPMDMELPVDKESESNDQKKDESSRRLGGLGADGRQMGENIGYSPSNIDFGERMSALHPICTRKPLHYEIGAGIFFRAKIHNLNLPGDMTAGPLGALANLAAAANMDTMDIPLANTALGKKLSSILPKGFCTEGVCDGTLPGCPGQMVKSMLIPKVEFKMARTFKWTLPAQQKAKDAVAYGMALMPELIRVTSIVVGSLTHSSTTPPPGSYPNSHYNHGSVVYVHGKPCRWTRPKEECSNVFSYKGVDYQGCSVEDHKDKGWCSVDRQFIGNWRNCFLTCQNSMGQDIEITDHSDRKLSEEEPETDSFLVEFEPEGMHYMVDEDLIHTLLKRKAFRGIEDGREAELGENEIVSFRVHKGDTELGEMISVGPEQKFEMDFTAHGAPPQQAAVSLGFTSLLAGAAVLGIASLVAGIYRITKRSGPTLPYVVVNADAEMPVE